MGRSGYVDDMGDTLEYGRWRGMVASAIRGKRGQKFIREAIVALDDLPCKRLGRGSLRTADGDFCTLGAVAQARGTNIMHMRQYCPRAVGEEFNISHALVAEIMYMNDDTDYYRYEADEERFIRMREWLVSLVK